MDDVPPREAPAGPETERRCLRIMGMGEWIENARDVLGPDVELPPEDTGLAVTRTGDGGLTVRRFIESRGLDVVDDGSRAAACRDARWYGSSVETSGWKHPREPIEGETWPLRMARLLLWLDENGELPEEGS